MNKKIKFIIATSVFTLGILNIEKISTRATMRGRIGNFFSELFRSCTGGNLRRASSEGEINSNIVHENLVVNRHLKHKVDELVNSNIISGFSCENFDKSRISNIEDNKYYHQNIVGGQKITLVSKNKPTLLGVSRHNVVLSVFTDENGESKSNSTLGYPRWIKGSTLKENTLD